MPFHRQQARLSALLGCLALLTGCGDPGGADASRGTLCIDVASGELSVVHDVARFPAANPATGRKTLAPALYCPKCDKWYPAPSMEQLHRQRGVARCPKTGDPLTPDGPWPAELEARR